MTQVRPYPLERLQKVTQAQARLSRSLSSYVAGTSASESLILGALGAVLDIPFQATFMGIKTLAPRIPIKSDMGWKAAVRFPGGADGIVFVDPFLTEAWLQQLNGEGTRLAGLNATEHGAMSFLLLKALEPLANQAAAPTVSLAQPKFSDLQRQWAKSGAVFELTWIVSGGEAAGITRLWLGGEAVSGLGPTVPSVDVSLAFDLVVGSTQLGADAVSVLGPADIVLFDSHGLNEHVGAYIKIDHNFRIPVGVDAQDDWLITVSGAPVNASQTTELMSEAQIELEVTIGTALLTLGELGSLQAGAIIETGSRVGEPVVLSVQGKTIGTGELVDVDGRIGVRIISRE